MIWNEKMECMAPDALKAVQSERLRETVRRVAANCPPYQKVLAGLGVTAEHIHSIDDLPTLPFTTKEDTRDNYPFGLFSAPLAQIAEIHVSSGTTGNPTVAGYTREDIALWSEVMARALACAGAIPGDMIQIAYGYGLFTGGLGFHYGALTMGLTILPISAGGTNRQLKLMADFRPRLLACTPSYCLYMAEQAREMGLDPRQSSWAIGSFGAEPWSESMRQAIEAAWNMVALDVYGLSEIIGPGVAHECSYKDGLHVFSDVFYPEVIDPKTGRDVAEGSEGELVLTTLTKQGMPLLRYRTRDIVSINRRPCRCGRTSPRISKIQGRTDDMIIVRGINVFPSQVEHVLLRIAGIQPYYQLIVDRKAGEMDELEVLVEAEEKVFFGDADKKRALQAKVRKDIQSSLGVAASVTLVEPKKLERSEGKAKRVVDKRVL